MATKPTADTGTADTGARPLPASITLNAPYSGFWDDGSFYAYDAGAVIHDATVIAYFARRDGALFTPAAE